MGPELLKMAESLAVVVDRVLAGKVKMQGTQSWHRNPRMGNQKKLRSYWADTEQ